MKIIRYKFLSSEIDNGTEEVLEQVFLGKEIRCNDSNFEANYALAQREAYNGEVTVEDRPDEIAVPTRLDQMEAQMTYTAMMTDTLLEV